MHGLIVQTAFLGDLLLMVPLLKNLKKTINSNRITLIARKGVGQPLLDLNLIDELIEVDKKNKDSLKSLKINITGRYFDWVICPHQSLRSALIVSKVKSPIKISYYKWWGVFFFNRMFNRNLSLPDALRQLSLIKGLDSVDKKLILELDTFKNSLSQSAVNFYQEEKIPDYLSMNMKESILSHYQNTLNTHSVKNLLYKKPILLAPGSVWATKRWTLDGYTKLALSLSERGETIIIIGSLDEKEIASEILSKVPNVIDLTGQSLAATLYLMCHSKALVANDSGAMHLASFSNLKTVSIFGPTVLAIGYRPWNSLSVVIQKPLKCRPCGKHGHKTCPIKTHECMTTITPEEVLMTLDKLLNYST